MSTLPKEQNRVRFAGGCLILRTKRFVGFSLTGERRKCIAGYASGFGGSTRPPHHSGFTPEALATFAHFVTSLLM